MKLLAPFFMIRHSYPIIMCLINSFFYVVNSGWFKGSETKRAMSYPTVLVLVNIDGSSFSVPWLVEEKKGLKEVRLHEWTMNMTNSQQ